MYKIGVIGDRDSILCFMAFGFEVFPVSNEAQDENRKLVDRLAREGFGLILITEQIAAALSETIDRYNKAAVPSILLIPSVRGSMGVGLKRIRDNVEKAVGINILD